MNAELHTLFQAYREERVDQPRLGTPEYTAMCERDHQRRLHAAAIIAEGGVTTADASIMQHYCFNTVIVQKMHGKHTPWHLKL